MNMIFIKGKITKLSTLIIVIAAIHKISYAAESLITLQSQLASFEDRETPQKAASAYGFGYASAPTQTIPKNHTSQIIITSGCFKTHNHAEDGYIIIYNMLQDSIPLVKDNNLEGLTHQLDALLSSEVRYLANTLSTTIIDFLSRYSAAIKKHLEDKKHSLIVIAHKDGNWSAEFYGKGTLYIRRENSIGHYPFPTTASIIHNIALHPYDYLMCFTDDFADLSNQQKKLPEHVTAWERPELWWEANSLINSSDGFNNIDLTLTASALDDRAQRVVEEIAQSSYNVWVRNKIEDVIIDYAKKTKPLEPHLDIYSDIFKYADAKPDQDTIFRNMDEKIPSQDKSYKKEISQLFEKYNEPHTFLTGSIVLLVHK